MTPPAEQDDNLLHGFIAALALAVMFWGLVALIVKELA